MKKKKKKNKPKRIVVTLSARDYEKLTDIKSQLAAIVIEKSQKVAANQLGLFDTLQLDIMGGVSKSENIKTKQ